MKNLDNWLKKSSFHHSDYSNIRNLVDLKEKRGLSISLCFPTLNEEKTIGKSIVIMKSELMQRYPLIDEIAVIDSGSTDNTCKIAGEFGADTYHASDYLKEEGEAMGKGENMWKALFLLKGDILMFIDADISNIHHRFAYGLLGPLLYNHDLKFVKAYYKRPFKSSDGILPSGGGRVTEVLVRPLFSQFFPELAGIIQPLSGEYAGYRELFEQIPFPIGYGVETGLLVDIYQKWGIDIIGQADLDLRIHRNQEITSLGKMSFGIMQTFWKRLKDYKDFGPIIPESTVLNQIFRQKNGEYEISEKDIVEKERRPMIEVEAYKKNR